MSIFRRMLIIAKLLEDSGSSLVLEFINGIILLNFEGKGTKTELIGTEVILNA